MPKRKTQVRRRVTASVDPGQGADVGAGAGVSVGQIDEFQEGVGLFEHYGPDAYVRVHKLNPVTKQWALIFRLSPEEATVETLQDFGGGGKYTCRRIEPDPTTGQLGITGTVTKNIEGPPKAVTRLPASMTRQDVAAGPAAPAAASGGIVVGGRPVSEVSMTEIMDMLKLKALAAGGEERKGSSTADILAAAAPLATAVAKMMEVMVARKEPVDVAMLVEKITASMHKADAAASPVAMFKEITDAMNNVLDLKDRTAGGGGDDGDPLLKMMTENLPRLLDILQGAMARRGGRVSEAELRREVAAAQGAKQLTGPLWQHFIQRNKRFLLKAATSGKRPEVQAAFAFDMMPDDLKGSVRELMAGHIADDGANAADQIIGLVPDFGAHRAWLQDFCDYLAGQFFPAEPEADADPAAAAAPEPTDEGGE